MELRHLRYFIMLAEELHFGKAAARLFISQPPLSRQIKELEEELGVILFLRSNKRVVLTEAGQFFLKQVREIFGKIEAARQQTLQIHHSLAGEIRIGYISSVDKGRLGQLIQSLQDEYPYLQTKIFELRTEKQIHALEDGRIDIGIIRGPNLSPQLLTEKLYDDVFCLALPKKMKLPNDLSILGTYPCISYHADYAPVYHELMLAFCAQLGFVPNLRHECNNISSMLELVHLNTGISVVPRSVRMQYKHLDVQFIDVEHNSIKTEILFAYAHHIEHPAFHILKASIQRLFTA